MPLLFACTSYDPWIRFGYFQIYTKNQSPAIPPSSVLITSGLHKILLLDIDDVFMGEWHG